MHHKKTPQYLHQFFIKSSNQEQFWNPQDEQIHFQSTLSLSIKVGTLMGKDVFNDDLKLQLEVVTKNILPH